MTIVAYRGKNHSSMDYGQHLQNEFPNHNALTTYLSMWFYQNLYFPQQQYAYFNFFKVTKII